MRILHVVPTYVPAWRYGGPIRSVHGLCKALGRAGHDVEVYTTDADGSGELEVPVGVPVDVEGVRVWYFPTRVRRIYWSPNMGAALRRSVRSFHIVHLHSIYLWPTLAGARAADEANVPYVLSPRGMLIPRLIEGKNRWIKKAWIQVFERRNLARAAAVHFTSRAEAAEASKLDLEFRRLLVLANGMDTEPEPTSSAAPGVTEELAGLGSSFLLFIGRLSWEKGLDRLIPAMKEIPDRTLVVAGGSNDTTYRKQLEALAHELGVSGRVRFVGPVLGNTKAWLLDNAAMLILPSYAESFGNVVLEAMAAGCPVAVTPEVGAAEIVRESGAGVVVPGDPATLGKSIRAALDAPDDLRKMGTLGREAFLETYTWDAVARRMAAAYTGFLDRP